MPYRPYTYRYTEKSESRLWIVFFLKRHYMYNCFFLLYNFKIHILPRCPSQTRIEHGKWKCIHGWFLRANWSSLWTRNILMNTNLQEVDDPVSLLYNLNGAEQKAACSNDVSFEYSWECDSHRQDTKASLNSKPTSNDRQMYTYTIGYVELEWFMESEWSEWRPEMTVGWCCAKCVANVLDWQNPFWHMSQLNGFRSEWVYLKPKARHINDSIAHIVNPYKKYDTCIYNYIQAV